MYSVALKDRTVAAKSTSKLHHPNFSSTAPSTASADIRILSRFDHYRAQLDMSYFKVTLMRSAIGLPARITGTLNALGLRKRMRTVYHPMTPDVAGQIMRVKELVDVQVTERALTHSEIRQLRKPDPGYYIETAMPRTPIAKKVLMEALQDEIATTDQSHPTFV